MNQQLIEALRSKEDKMIEIKRYSHQHPELSLHGDGTTKHIAEFYKGKDVEVETNVGPRGIKVTIDSGKPGKASAIRVGFNVLPITEDAGLFFASQSKSVMYVCSYDARTTYIPVLAEMLTKMKDSFTGEIVVTHQPAEEVPPGGVKTVAENDVLDGVDYILDVHVTSTMETGNVYYRPDYVQTRRAFFKLKVQGKGGHDSSPRVANDAIVAGSYFVTTLRTIISRRLGSFGTGVVIIDSFDGKGQPDVTKDVVEIEGDIRGLTDTTKATIEKEIKRLSKGLKTLCDVTCTLEYNDDYPVLYNDPELTRYVAKTLKKADLEFGAEICRLRPPPEDFACYTKERPGAFIYTGATMEDGETYLHYHPKFKISEKSLPISAETAGTAILDYLKGDN